MHRLATIPGETSNEEILLVEQPQARVLVLSSVTTDISTLANCLVLKENIHWHGEIRALNLSSLNHPAQIDHYFEITAQNAELIIVRLLGGKGHWSYGLEKLATWQKRKNTSRKIIITAGTEDQFKILHPLSTINENYVDKLARLLNVGGMANVNTFLDVIDSLLNNKLPPVNQIIIKEDIDVEKWDWKEDKGKKIGIILYRALLQSGDLEFATALNKKLRKKGLSPRVIWVKGLKDINVQRKIIQMMKIENVDIILSSTSFTSVELNSDFTGKSFWDELDVPVLQLLTSSNSRERWEGSCRGLDPIDLSLQIVLPELDGRITTRPCAFKILEENHNLLATAIHRLKPDNDGLEWISNHIKAWLDLKYVIPRKKKICLILANYPIRDGRIANGVGLDTPESTVQILKWLKEYGISLGDKELPSNSDELMNSLLAVRTNDPGSRNRPTLDYLSLNDYMKWWDNISYKARSPIVERWGEPKSAIDIETQGFPIHGIELGNVCILIQPSRGYDSNSEKDLHSPDLFPPHRYLAQYLWIRDNHKSNLIVHIGKHGSVEWLPGKSVGLSKNCAPALAMGYLPNLYPFIVNDPGEGTQAKRRTHAVILDHLTPPLGRAGAYGDLLILENLIEEYYDSKLLCSERNNIVISKILKLIEKNHLLDLDITTTIQELELEEILCKVDSYLCELKQSQIRTGLHILGMKINNNKLSELMLSISRTPSRINNGFTQILAKTLNLKVDPWADDESEYLENEDIVELSKYNIKPPRNKGVFIDWLEGQALIIIQAIVENKTLPLNQNFHSDDLIEPFKTLLTEKNTKSFLKSIRSDLMFSIQKCAVKEKQNFLKVVDGKRIEAGPSGAPTRGKPEVLPTGRNFYSVDLRGLPTESAWDLGRRTAQNLLDLYLLENGEDLTHLALSVWGTATMRNGGEEIGQLFALIGVRPVWDGPTRRFIDIEVIPLSVLGRPRVDVTLRISGFFRDAFPQLIYFVNKAQNIVGNLKEPSAMNPYSAFLREGNEEGRVYGSAPGAYGAGLQALIDSGAWDNKKDLANAYLAWSQWKYEGYGNPIPDKKGLVNCLKKIQVVLHNQDNREHDILDSDDYYQFHGGLSAAVEQVSGTKPNILLGDNSRRERPKINTLKKEIEKVVISRLLNPRWIEGIKEHGYKGAFEMSASLDYLFAYDAATDNVPDWCYSKINEEWLGNNSTIEFLLSKNPWVLRDMAEKFLEASNRGMWKNAGIQEKNKLIKMLNEAETIIENTN